MATLSARILTTLLDWYPVRNPIRVSVRDTTAVTGSGVRGAIMFTFGSVPGDGTSWSLDVGSEVAHSINFLNTPVDADWDVDVSGSPTTEDWVRDTLVPFMQGYFDLTEIYDVSYDPAHPTSVSLTVRSGFTGNDDPIPSTFENGFTLDAVDEQPGEDLVIEPDISYVVKLYVEDETVVNNLDADNDFFTEVASDTFSPSPTPNGTVELDLSEWLFAYAERNQPAPDAASCVALVGASRRFRLGMARRFYVPLDPETEIGDFYSHGRMAISGTSYAIAAGRSPEDILTNPDWKNMLCHDSTSADVFRFLTNWPNLTRQQAKVITPDQVEYLCFIAPEDIDADVYELSVRITCTDGTTAAFQEVPDFAVALKQGRVYAIPFGLNLRNLWSYVPGKVPHIIQVRIQRPLEDHSAYPISESRWFRIDYDHHQQARQFHYFNSLCGIDTLLLTGEASADLTPDLALGGRYVLGADTTLAKQRAQVPVFDGFTEEFQAGIRLLTRPEIVAARELYFSDNIVERDAQGIVRPVVLTAKKAPSLEESERMRSLPVQYKYNLNLKGSSVQLPTIP